MGEPLRIDTHVHVADARSFRAAPAGRRMLPFMLRRARAGRSAPKQFVDPNEEQSSTLARWIRESSLDRVILLALDGVYDYGGNLVPELTRLMVDNDFVREFAGSQPEFLFGASIHPYRKEAVKELERFVGLGACVVKWIPSSQHIEPDNPRCYPFYEALAHYGIPLLSHTGVEHTLGSGLAHYNHPRRLIPALKAGAKVIAAHCGAHFFLYEPSYFDAWARLAREYENMFGDLSAFPVVTRARYVRRIFRDKVLMGKVLYGSDYPSVPSPYWCWQLGPAGMREMAMLANPLERNLRMMKALGMSEKVFKNVNQVFSTLPEVRTHAQ